MLWQKFYCRKNRTTFGFHYYKCDDHLEKYLEIASARHKPISHKMSTLTIDETFLRPVNEQVSDEITFYEEVFELILKDLKMLSSDKAIILEGAALLPNNVASIAISKNKYVCIVPSAEFQLEKYAEREWVSHYLRESSNPKAAYDNWMKRDIEFAKIVSDQAKSIGYRSILVDGSASIDENYRLVLDILGLEA